MLASSTGQILFPGKDFPGKKIWPILLQVFVAYSFFFSDINVQIIQKLRSWNFQLAALQLKIYFVIEYRFSGPNL